MNAFDRYFRAPFRGVRAYAFSKLFLGMVALDTWMLMIGHAGRYGVDGFNVAHFNWLDRLMPVPTATLYVGVLLLTGLLALAIALGGSHPIALFMLFLLYTFSWSMSMLDSYQHHYFVSSILLCLVFFPRLSAADVTSGAPGRPARREIAYVLVAVAAISGYALIDAKRHALLWFGCCAGTLAIATWFCSRWRRSERVVLVSGFGFNLLGATVGILYTFTSVAKMDEQWIAGNTIRRISSAGRIFAPLADFAGNFGISNERFWALLSTSVIPLELAVALAYLLAVLQDSSRARWLSIATGGAFWLALSLHVGAEAMGLEIGWFSYYMLALACAYLLPGPAIETLASVLIVPSRWVASLLDDDSAKARRPGELAIAIVGAAVVLFAVAYLIDLPGAFGAASVAVGSLIGCGIAAAVSGEVGYARRLAIASGFAAALMWTAIGVSSVRWDFYRYLGGDLSRRGRNEAALEAFERGERYAPKGESRRNKIDALRHALGR